MGLKPNNREATTHWLELFALWHTESCLIKKLPLYLGLNATEKLRNAALQLRAWQEETGVIHLV